MVNLELTEYQAELLKELIGNIDAFSVKIILSNRVKDRYSDELAEKVHENNAYIWDILNKQVGKTELFNGISCFPIVLDHGKERCPCCYKELDTYYHGLKICYCKYCGGRIIR